MSYGPPPQYQPYMPQQQAPRPNRVRNGCLIAAGCVAGGIVLLIIIGAVLSAANKTAGNGNGTVAQSSPASTGTTPRVSSTAKPATTAKVLATFSGTGVENTAKFTVSGTWKLKWSYNCATLGSSGNFIVLEDGSAAGAVTVNELGNGGHGVTYGYNDSGRHYLDVNSECPWTVKVVGTR